MIERASEWLPASHVQVFDPDPGEAPGERRGGLMGRVTADRGHARVQAPGLGSVGRPFCLRDRLRRPSSALCALGRGMGSAATQRNSTPAAMARATMAWVICGLIANDVSAVTCTAVSRSSSVVQPLSRYRARSMKA